MSLLPALSSDNAPFKVWLIDLGGNIAMSRPGLALLRRIRNLRVPFFSSTEQATSWGSRLNAAQHATLVEIQRSSSNAALGASNLQEMVSLATQSQLLREAAEAFVPGRAEEKYLPLVEGGPTHRGGELGQLMLQSCPRCRHALATHGGGCPHCGPTPDAPGQPRKWGDGAVRLSILIALAAVGAIIYRLFFV